MEKLARPWGEGGGERSFDLRDQQKLSHLLEYEGGVSFSPGLRPESERGKENTVFVDEVALPRGGLRLQPALHEDFRLSGLVSSGKRSRIGDIICRLRRLHRHLPCRGHCQEIA